MMSDDGVVDVRRIVELPDQIGQLVTEASAPKVLRPGVWPKDR